MSDGGGGYGSPGPPPPGYPPPGGTPPGYPPPPAPGHGPPPGYGGHGYGPPPGYGGYGYGGYGYGGYGYGGYGGYGYGSGGYGQGYAPQPVAFKPGVIPLRPLTLSDIFNGAVTYIRANPKATLGLTTIVVVITQLLALVLSAGPFAFTGQLEPALSGEEVSTGVLLGSTASSLAGAVATGLSSILLSGLLTVVVGRAVFGASITVGEAWQRLKGRLWALIAFTVLEVLGAAILIGIVVGVIAYVAIVANGAAAAVIGIPLVLGLIVALVYLGTMLTFVPPVIVLERLDIISAVTRSFKLIKGDFWRVLGIRLLAVIVTQVVAGAVAIPFSVGGQIVMMAASSTAMALLSLVLLSIGSAIGQIITAPFGAGVVVLQYTDRRIRAEAFDLVLQTGAAQAPAAGAHSTDDLWLTRRF